MGNADVDGSSSDAYRDRVARVAVLALRLDGALVNLLTVVRHRHVDAIGPFARPVTPTWDERGVHDDLMFATRDIAYPDLGNLTRQMHEGELKVGTHTVAYELDPHEYHSRAWQDWTDKPASELRSPFHHHSAEVAEFWRFDAEPLVRRWSTLRDELGDKPSTFRLGIDLARYIDRVGNLLVFGALDEVKCGVDSGHDNVLRVSIEPTERRDPEGYRVCVWASQGNDPVLRRLADVGFGETAFPTSADVDRLGLQVFRRSDGECIHYTDGQLLGQIGGTLNLAGPNRRVKVTSRQKTREIEYRGASMYGKFATKLSVAESNQKMRQARCERQADHSERMARQRGEVVRFSPGQAEEAIARMQRYLLAASDTQPVYLADPYFLGTLEGDVLEKFEFYSKILDARAGAALRILVCTKDVPPWWHQMPTELTRSVEARGFFRTDSRERAFHDRWLVTSQCELLFTHSFNGWQKGGVTFVAPAAGVYGDLTTALWSLPDGEGPEYVVERLWPPGAE